MSIFGTAKTHVKSALLGSALFTPTRTLYLNLFNQPAAAKRCRMRRFYSQFFNKGDLVFDIGANIGEYAEIFASLGAQVLAVEPNPACCKLLHKLSLGTGFMFEQCAVGECEGVTRLWISEDSHLSTVSESWIDETKGIPSLSEAKWLRSIDVPLTTLDALSQRYGTPQFVKVDIEGSEEQALAGMSFAPAYLSFEYHISTRDIAARCMKTLETYQFNVISGDDLIFKYSNWVSASEINHWLETHHGDQDYGDIFARRQPG